jgi:hypothetical protein
MKPDHVITIKLPTGVEFKTTAVAPNRLRERGKVAAFFEEAKVQPEDVLNIEQTSADVWQVSKS